MSSVPAPRATPPAGGAPAVPPTVQVFQMFFGVLVTQIVLTMTEHDIPERLAGGPMTSAELAAATGLHEGSLYRVLRTATGLGLVTQDGDGRFGLGPLGEAARQYDHLSWAFPVLTQLSGVLQTGKSGSELAFGKELFDWLEDNPEEGANFDRAIRLVHGGEDIAIAEAYDFGAVRSVVDVGGGNGTVLATLLARNPQLEGVVLDLPSVIGRGMPALDAHAGRWEAVGGDFFEGVPPAGTRTCSRTSSTTGARSGRSRSSATAGPPWVPTPGCSSSRCRAIRGRDAPREDARRAHARHQRAGHGADRGAVRRAPRPRGVPAAARRAHGVGREHRRSGASAQVVLHRPGVALGRVVGILACVAQRAPLTHEVPEAVELDAHLLETGVLLGLQATLGAPALEEPVLLGDEPLDVVGDGLIGIRHARTVRLRRPMIYRP